ncbi:MAG TPA: inorganic phosphate transporter [bacterium (Candidatus Stahlbacteria)]|nr:inorganic phosphate transporter [Candidatus Stahlbacteria bacterium]
MIILYATALAGFYMAWNIGANDVANSMSSAVGARAITVRQAIFIAAILNIIGAAFVGGHVTETIRKGIVAIDMVKLPKMVMFGSFSALLAAAIWVFVSTWQELPVSTTHSIVGAMIGFGIITTSFGGVRWGKVIAITSSWVISPFFSGLIAYLIFYGIRKLIIIRDDPDSSLKVFGPVMVGITFFIIIFSLFAKTPLSKRFSLNGLQIVSVSLLGGILGMVISGLLIGNFLKDRTGDSVEEVFRRLQIMTSCYVAFAHGANDVANAIGPVASVFSIATTGEVQAHIPVPTMLLVFGGIGIAVGIMTWGYRVIRTVAFKITHLTNTSGFSVDFGTATAVLLASKLGLPVSTTHAAVGAIVGVGLARGFEAVDFRVVRRITLFWILTLPVAALTAMLFYLFLQSVG